MSDAEVALVCTSRATIENRLVRIVRRAGNGHSDHCRTRVLSICTSRMGHSPNSNSADVACRNSRFSQTDAQPVVTA